MVAVFFIILCTKVLIKKYRHFSYMGKNIIRLQEVDSTNDYLLKEIHNGSISDEGTIVVADS